MRQTDLADIWDAPPLARSTDPWESHAGADDAEERLGELQAYVLRCVWRHPGMTCNELARAEHVRDPRQIGRRLNELEKRECIRRGPGRTCAVTGRKAAPWWPVKES